MLDRTISEPEHDPTLVVRRRSRRFSEEPTPLDSASPLEGQVVEIPLVQIRAGDNDRTVFDEAKIDELAASIKESTLAQPITVRPIKDPTFLYEIVAGERRFRACAKLGLETIPAIVRRLSDEQAAEIMLIENIQRADLNPMDEANAYQKRMDKFGWSVSQVADKTKKNPKHVSARIALLSLIPEMQDMLRKEQVSVQFGEIMAPLDYNRQRIAFRYLASTERPLLREFRAIVGNLAADQAQNALLDSDVFIRETVAANGAERTANLSARRFPIDERLPQMQRVGSIGASFEQYIAQLLASDDDYLRTAAPIVGRIYDSLLRGGMAYAPGTSPKKKS